MFCYEKNDNDWITLFVNVHFDTDLHEFLIAGLVSNFEIKLFNVEVRDMMFGSKTSVSLMIMDLPQHI